jgi:hypothetical protein
MQQHEDRLMMSAAPIRSLQSFENIPAMLERTAGLAIKKTVSCEG